MLPCLLLLATSGAAAQDPDLELFLLGTSASADGALDELLADLLVDGVEALEEVGTGQFAPGGFTLADHLLAVDGTWGDTPSREALITGSTPPDLVVLHEDDGPPRDSGAPFTVGRDAAAELTDLVATEGGGTLLLQTWARRDERFAAAQAELERGLLAYAAAASTPEHALYTAPVGRAWSAVWEADRAAGTDPLAPGSAFHGLYDADGFHPSAAGSFLAAHVLYAAWTGRDPTELTDDRGLGSTRAVALRRHARDVVLTDPFGPFRYPWAHLWSDRFEDGAEALVSDPVHALSIALVEPARAGSVVLGATSGSRAHLAIEGGSLETGTITVGRAGSGDVVQTQGAVAAARLILAEEAGSQGSWTLAGGSVDVAHIEVGAGSGGLVWTGGTITGLASVAADLDQEGGVLRPAADLQVDGDYALLSGAVLDLGAGSLRVGGRAGLAGLLRVSDVDRPRVVLRARAIDLRGLALDAPPGTTLQLVSAGLEEGLELGPPPDTPAAPAPEEACGCAGRPAPTAWVGVALAALFAARRRPHGQG